MAVKQPHESVIILVFCIGIKGVSYSLEHIGIIHGGRERHLLPWVTDITADITATSS